MSLFSIDKNLHRKKLNPFTSNSSCIRLTASGFSESRAWSETKRQINGKRGGEIRAERGDGTLIFRSQGHLPSFLKPFFDKEAAPQVSLPTPCFGRKVPLSYIFY